MHCGYRRRQCTPVSTQKASHQNLPGLWIALAQGDAQAVAVDAQVAVLTLAQGRVSWHLSGRTSGLLPSLLPSGSGAGPYFGKQAAGAQGVTPALVLNVSYLLID